MQDNNLKALTDQEKERNTRIEQSKPYCGEVSGTVGK